MNDNLMTPSNAEPLQEFYDRKYSGSDVRAVRKVPLVHRPRNRLEMAAKVAASGAGGRYLEIAAGDGGLAAGLVDFYDQLVLTEFSRPRVALMRELFRDRPHVTVLQNDLDRQGLAMLESESFDTVTMVAVIEHLVEPIAALREAHRVLKPGGRLLLDTANVAKWTRRLKLLAGRFPSTSSRDEGLLGYDGCATELHDQGHLHYFTFRSITRLAVERAGFRRATKYGYGPTILSRLWPEMFSDAFLVFHK